MRQLNRERFRFLKKRRSSVWELERLDERTRGEGGIKPYCCQLLRLAAKHRDIKVLIYMQQYIKGVLQDPSKSLSEAKQGDIIKQCINNRDSKGITPLMCALRRFGAEAEMKEVVDVLLTLKADIRATDYKNNSTLYHGLLAGHSWLLNYYKGSEKDFTAQDKKSSKTRLKYEANLRNSESCFGFGMLLKEEYEQANKSSVEKKEEYIRYLKTAAEFKDPHPGALLMLRLEYEGSDKVYWLEKAAEQGVFAAYILLGDYYRSLPSISSSYNAIEMTKKAIDLYKQAYSLPSTDQWETQYFAYEPPSASPVDYLCKADIRDINYKVRAIGCSFSDSLLPISKASYILFNGILRDPEIARKLLQISTSQYDSGIANYLLGEISSYCSECRESYFISMSYLKGFASYDCSKDLRKLLIVKFFMSMKDFRIHAKDCDDFSCDYCRLQRFLSRSGAKKLYNNTIAQLAATGVTQQDVLSKCSNYRNKLYEYRPYASKLIDDAFYSVILSRILNKGGILSLFTNNNISLIDVFYKKVCDYFKVKDESVNEYISSPGFTLERVEKGIVPLSMILFNVSILTWIYKWSKVCIKDGVKDQIGKLEKTSYSDIIFIRLCELIIASDLPLGLYKIIKHKILQHNDSKIDVLMRLFALTHKDVDESSDVLKIPNDFGKYNELLKRVVISVLRRSKPLRVIEMNIHMEPIFMLLNTKHFSSIEELTLIGELNDHQINMLIRLLDKASNLHKLTLLGCNLNDDSIEKISIASVAHKSLKTLTYESSDYKSAEGLQKHSSKKTVSPSNKGRGPGELVTHSSRRPSIHSENSLLNQWPFKNHKYSSIQQLIEAWEKTAIQESIKMHQDTLASENRLKAEAKSFGFGCNNVNKDGNCFFNVVEDQLRRPGLTDRSAADLRAIAVSHVIENFSEYKGFITVSKDKFILDISRSGEWADDLIIIAMSRALDITIVIIRNDGADPTIKRRANPDRVLYFGYEVGNHYQSLVKFPNTDIPPEKDINAYIKRTKIDKWQPRSIPANLLSDVPESVDIVPEAKDNEILDSNHITGEIDHSKALEAEQSESKVRTLNHIDLETERRNIIDRWVRSSLSSPNQNLESFRQILVFRSKCIFTAGQSNSSGYTSKKETEVQEHFWEFIKFAIKAIPLIGESIHHILHHGVDGLLSKAELAVRNHFLEVGAETVEQSAGRSKLSIIEWIRDGGIKTKLKNLSIWLGDKNGMFWTDWIDMFIKIWEARLNILSSDKRNLSVLFNALFGLLVAYWKGSDYKNEINAKIKGLMEHLAFNDEVYKKLSKYKVTVNIETVNYEYTLAEVIQSPYISVLFDNASHTITHRHRAENKALEARDQLRSRNLGPRFALDKEVKDLQSYYKKEIVECEYEDLPDLDSGCDISSAYYMSLEEIRINNPRQLVNQVRKNIRGIKVLNCKFTHIESHLSANDPAYVPYLPQPQLPALTAADEKGRDSGAGGYGSSQDSGQAQRRFATSTTADAHKNQQIRPRLGGSVVGSANKESKIMTDNNEDKKSETTDANSVVQVESTEGSNRDPNNQINKLRNEIMNTLRMEYEEKMNELRAEHKKELEEMRAELLAEFNNRISGLIGSGQAVVVSQSYNVDVNNVDLEPIDSNGEESEDKKEQSIEPPATANHEDTARVATSGASNDKAGNGDEEDDRTTANNNEPQLGSQQQQSTLAVQTAPIGLSNNPVTIFASTTTATASATITAVNNSSQLEESGVPATTQDVDNINPTSQPGPIEDLEQPDLNDNLDHVDSSNDAEDDVVNEDHSRLSNG